MSSQSVELNRRRAGVKGMSVDAAMAADGPADIGLELDPLDADLLVYRYDIELGYKRYHLSCMDKAQRDRLGPLDLLSRRGFAGQRVLSEDTSAALVDKLRQGGGALGPRDLGRDGIGRLFEEMFCGPLDETLRRFFNCPYGVLFLDLSVSRPMTADALAGPENLSYSWHCDVAPTPYVKLLVYLSGSGEHDGATEFLDMATTAQFRRAGYVFCRKSQRLGDLGDLARLHAIDLAPERLCPEQGEAAVFSPSQVMHKGIAPSYGERVLMSVGVIPALTDWRAFLTSNFGYMCSAKFGEFPQVA